MSVPAELHDTEVSCSLFKGPNLLTRLPGTARLRVSPTVVSTVSTTAELSTTERPETPTSDPRTTSDAGTTPSWFLLYAGGKGHSCNGAKATATGTGHRPLLAGVLVLAFLAL